MKKTGMGKGNPVLGKDIASNGFRNTLSNGQVDAKFEIQLATQSRSYKIPSCTQTDREWETYNTTLWRFLRAVENIPLDWCC